MLLGVTVKKEGCTAKSLTVDFRTLERQRKSIAKLIDKSSDEKFVIITKKEHEHLQGIENMLNDICDFFYEQTNKHNAKSKRK